MTLPQTAAFSRDSANVFFHILTFKENQLIAAAKINESDFFRLDIPQGCVMNKLIQPYNLSYRDDGRPDFKIACCLTATNSIVKHCKPYAKK